MSLYSLSSKIAKYVTEEAELDHSQTDSIRYGMEIILGALIKGITLLSTAYFLEILPQVIIALICGSLLRLMSGGAHCTSYLRCLSCGLFIYLFTGKAALYFEQFLTRDQLVIILLPCFFIMALCAYLWAPAEVPYRSIDFNESILFKVLTIAFLIILLLIVLFYANQIKLSFIIAGLLALLVQTFSFAPVGYLLFGKIDTFLFNITAKKGGELNNA